MNNKVRIGFIGTGFARTVQIPAFLMCENAEIASVASYSLANAEKTAKQFDIPHFTDDWRETVTNENVDLVCITTPPPLHCQQTLAALEAGKHVLCEKPMAMSVAESAKMTAKAKEKGLLALIDFELRFQQGRQKAFELIRGGEIGKIRHAKYNFRAPQRGNIDIPWNWWSDKTQGGGAVGAMASHIIDSFYFYLGTEASSVFCQLQTHIKQRKDPKTNEMRDVTTDDEAMFVFRFAENEFTEDATGLISLSVTEQPNYQNTLEFFGTKGAIRIQHRGELFITKNGESDWTEIATDIGTNIDGVGDSGFARGFTAFAPKIIEAIEQGKTEIEFAANFEDGLKVQKVIDAAHESNEKGCIINI
ncbi:MAG TPA: Gfo/Idh/MocA family oxidoreductase [Pyrinomonadaceae bacterium]|nr:Gfo/Idh/MocA family oxidoreductase [Pyrinomonadaceae bacterium]